MVTITISDTSIQLTVQGWDKLFALRSELEIPLRHVLSVRVDPEPARGWWHGLKMGTNVPGVITAGSFYQSDGFVFYDVHDPERTIVLELDHEHYKRLVVEVEDPAATVAALKAAISKR